MRYGLWFIIAQAWDELQFSFAASSLDLLFRRSCGFLSVLSKRASSRTGNRIHFTATPISLERVVGTHGGGDCKGLGLWLVTTGIQGDGCEKFKENVVRFVLKVRQPSHESRSVRKDPALLYGGRA